MTVFGTKAKILYEGNNATLADDGTIATGWLDLQEYDKYQISAYQSVTGGDGMRITLESYGSGATADTTQLTSFTDYTAGGFFLANLIARQRYMKFTLTNRTGSTSSSTFEIKGFIGSSDKLSVFPVSVDPSAFSQAALVQSITRGRQPDGDYVNSAADGSAFSTSTVLNSTSLTNSIGIDDTDIVVNSVSGLVTTDGTVIIDSEIITYETISGTTLQTCVRGAYTDNEGTGLSHAAGEPVGECYVSPWTDSDGWNSIELFIKSDTESSPLGVVIQYTRDAQATPISIDYTKKYTYSAIDVEAGGEVINVPPVLDGFRIIYGNGPTTQTSFFLDATLKTNSTNTRNNRGGAILIADFNTEVKLGLISNYAIGSKFGRETAIGTTMLDICNVGGPYTGQPYPYSYETARVSSGSESDTNALGPAIPTVTLSADASLVYISASSTGHGLLDGDTVNFTGATGLGDNITAALLNTDHKIVSVDANNFRFIVFDSTNTPVRATSGDSSGGGGSIVAKPRGAGAHVIRVTGLKTADAVDYESEDVELSGTTEVITTNVWYRINRIEVIKAGTLGHNVGIITVKQETLTSNVFGTIAAEENQSTIAAYTVPYNKKLLIKNLRVSTSNTAQQIASANVFLRVRRPGEVYRNVKNFDIQEGGIYVEDVLGGLLIPSGSDIIFSARSTGSGMTVNVSFDYQLTTGFLSL